MRVTTGMFYNDLLQNIQQNLEPMLNSQEELSTGLRMNKPSDDPADLGTVMSLSSILAQNNSEATALTTRQSRLSETDSALGQATTILNRVQTLIEEADNTTSNSSDNSDIAQEVLQLLKEMVDTANSTRGTGPGENFFTFDSSTNTVSNAGSPTVSADTISHDTVDPNAIFWNTGVVSGGTASGAGSSSTSTTSDYTNPGVFQVIQNVYNDLSTNNTGQFTTDLTQVADAASWITAQRAQVGAVENRLTSLQTQITNQNQNLTQLMASFRDTDVESATVRFSQEQATYQAALATSAKVMQISLTNYLTV